ncbi:MAG: fibronectin type III domain-containing protein, partial [Flavobacteriales bacterium]|nr:fibronectin type III domain-containing protein [Flavobacteriales bacterium]
MEAPDGSNGDLDLYVDMSAATGNTKLRFDYINGDGSDALEVFLSTDGGTSFSSLGAPLAPATVWTTVEYTLSSTSPTTVLRFRAHNQLFNNNTDIGLDNVRLLTLCTGAPPAATASVADGVICPGGTDVLTATGISTYGDISFKWEQSNDGLTGWMDVTGGSGATTATYTTAPLYVARYYRLLQICTATGQSTPSNVVAVTMDLPTYAVYDGVSFAEGFESWTNRCSTTDAPTANWGSIPFTTSNSWRRNDQGASAAWTSATSGGYSPAFSTGAYSARFHSYGTTTGSTGALDLYIDMSAAAGMTRLSFDHINTAGTDKLQVLVSTDGGLNFSQVGSDLGVSATWTNHTFDFASASATTVIRLLATGLALSSDIGVDNLNLEPAPSCLEPTNLAVVTTSPTSMDLSWGASPSSPANGYLWEVRTAGAAGSGATGLEATGTTVSGVLTASASPLTTDTTYAIHVRAVCGAGDSSPWVSIPSYFLGYCVPAPGSINGTGITNVAFGTLNNPSGDETGHFGDYTALTGGDVQQTLNANVAITYATGATYGTKIWVDWNGDADFSDAGELMYTGLSAATNPTTLNASFNVGTHALGSYRMRIGGTNTDSGPSSPCYTGTQGTFEDYTLNITAPPSCIAPTGLAASPADVNALLTWVASTSTPDSYQWEVRTSGAGGSGATGLVVSGITTGGATNATAAPLTPTTSYQLYVRSICSVGDSSVWSGPVAFTTLCQIVSSYPYLQSFGSTMPSCWSASEGTSGASYHWSPTTADATHGAAGPQAGTNFMYLYVYLASTTYNPYNLTTGAFNLGASPKLLSYYYWLGADGYTDSPVPLAVQISTNGGVTWTNLYQHNSSNSTFSAWTENTIDLTAYANMTVIFRFQGNSNYGSNFCDMGIDEFRVYDVPACYPPVATTTIQEDCGNSQFYIGVNLTSLGDASSVAIESDYAGNPGGVTAATVVDSTYVLGPFADLSTVNIVLVHSGNSTCNDTLAPVTYNCAFLGQNALSFDGVDDRVDLGDPASLDITGTQITLEAWIYPTAWRANSWQGNIVNSESNATAGYMIRCGNNGQLSFNLGDGSSWHEVLSATNALTLNTWQHVAGTYDGTTMRLFLNGVQVGSQPASFSIASTGTSTVIGDWSNGTGRNFPGKIDEVRIWNIAKGASSILNRMDTAYCGNEGGLVGYYRFDQGTDAGNNTGLDTLIDASTYGNQGTLTGFALNGATSNWVQGVTGMGDCIPVTCDAPVGLAVSNITADNVLITWTDTTATNYQYEVRTSGAVGSGAAGLTASGNSPSGAPGITINGLDGNTAYQVYVRSDCGVDGFSVWQGPVSFTTLCDPATVPYYENFDTALAIPDCWANTGTGENWLVQVSGGSGPGYGVAGALDHTSGTGNFTWIDGSSNITDNSLETKWVDLTGLSYPYVSFWMLSNNTDDAAQNQIQLQAWNGTDWDTLLTFGGNDPDWVKHGVLVPTSIPDITHFRIVAIPSLAGSQYYNDLLIDDFAVEELTLCTGMPAPGATTGPATSCSGSEFTLGIANDPGSVIGFTYQWQSSPDSLSWTDIAGATALSLDTSLTADTWYRCVVTCTASGLDTTSTPLHVLLNTNACECGNYPAVFASSTADEEITSVTVGTMTNTSDCTTLAPGAGSIQNRYSNYTGFVAAPDLQQGTTVAFSIDGGTCGGNYSNVIQVAIDYNHDGDFADAGELVYSQAAATTGAHTEAGDFTVPFSATPGITRMRVVQVETSTTTTNWAQTGYSWGETEDYCVNITPGNGCTGQPNPGNTVASASIVCLNSTVDLSLQNSTPGGGVTYAWEQSTDGGATWVAFGTNAETQSPVVTDTTLYRCTVTCTATGLDSTSVPVSVNVNTNACECGGYPAVFASSTGDEDIMSVTVGTMTNTSDCTTLAPGAGSIQNRYSNYTGFVAAPDLTQGDTITFSIDGGTCGGNYSNVIQLAIDFNHDGDFADAGELVYSDAASVQGAHTASGSFVVPFSATQGITRMRVVQVETSTTTTNWAQTGYSWGETEDYCVNIVAGTPCTGQPDPGNTIASASLVCDSSTVDLSLQNIILGGGVTYTWERSTDGGTTWTAFGSNGPSVSDVVTQDVLYHCVVACTVSGQDSTSALVSVTVNTNPCECGSYPVAYAAYSGDEDILNVTVGTLNNTSDCTTPAPGPGSILNRYGNYTGAVAAPDLPQSAPTSFSIQGGTCGGDYGNGIQVAIDFNQDGDFADAGELVYNQPAATTGPHTVTGSFIVPATATLGITRMRVVVVETTFPTSTNYAQTGYSWGETEDYCVNITLPPPCVPPTALAFSNVTATSADLGWTAATPPPANGYQWEVRTSGAAGSGATGLVDSGNATGTTATTSLLSPLTTYSLYVRSDCGGTFSSWNGPVAVTTPCLVDAVPFYEGFEGYADQTAVAGCWTQAAVSGTNNWTANSTLTSYNRSPRTGSFNTYLRYGNTRWLFRAVALTGGTTYRFSAYARQDGATSANASLTLAYGTSASAAAMTNVVATQGLVNGNYQLVQGDFTPATTGTYYIGIKGTINSSPWYISLDDISLEEVSTCAGTPDPGSTTGPSLACSASNFTLGISNDPGATLGYTYQWQTSPDGITWTNAASATAMTFTTSLTADTWYQCVVTCTNSGQISTSTPLHVLLNADACACGNYPAIFASSTVDEDITNVTVGTLNNSSTCSTVAPGPGSIQNRYSNYAGTLPAPMLQQGAPVSFSITGGTCGGSYNNIIQVYIDYNKDGDFLDAGEQVYNQPSAISGAHTVSGSFTVPLTATLGTTRMRVVQVETSTTTTNWAQTAYSWGETEDYCVEIGLPPSCLPPTAPTLASVGTSTASFSWTASGSSPSNYQWEVRSSGAGGSGATGLVASGTTSGTTANATGLTSSTAYSFYVRANCGGGDLSFWAGPLNFTTGAACGDPFTDTGGASAAYGNNENWVKTICRTTPGDQVRVVFSTFSTEASYDKLFIFNGPSTAAPMFASSNGAGYGNTTYGAGGWWGDMTANLPGPFQSNNASGCLTFAFVSDVSGTAAGWTATTSCVQANNTCSNALPVLCGGNYLGNTSGVANNLPAGACAFNGAPSTGGQNWWSFTATSSQAVTFSTCGSADFDTRISVFSGANCSALACVAMGDDAPGCAGGGSSVTVNTVTGTTYWIAVHGAGAAEGSYTLHVSCTGACTPPANDACAGAIALPNNLADGSNTAATYTNACAAVDAPTSCSGAMPVSGVWFSFNSGNYTRALITLLDNGDDSQYSATNVDFALFAGSCDGMGASGATA